MRRPYCRRCQQRVALLTLLLLACVFATTTRAVTVGDVERRLGDGSDADDEMLVDCPPVTTFARVNGTSVSATTSAQVVDPLECDERETVRGQTVANKTNANESFVELDARKLGIRRVVSIPVGIHVLCVGSCWVVCVVLWS